MEICYDIVKLNWILLWNAFSETVLLLSQEPTENSIKIARHAFNNWRCFRGRLGPSFVARRNRVFAKKLQHHACAMSKHFLDPFGLLAARDLCWRWKRKFATLSLNTYNHETVKKCEIHWINLHSSEVPVAPRLLLLNSCNRSALLISNSPPTSRFTSPFSFPFALVSPNIAFIDDEVKRWIKWVSQGSRNIWHDPLQSFDVTFSLIYLEKFLICSFSVHTDQSSFFLNF